MSNDPNVSPQQPGPGTEPKPAGDSNENMMGMLSHLLGIFTGFIGALVIWLMKKDTNGFAATEAKEALNFQLTVLIIGLPIWILMAILMCVFWPLAIIFVIALAAVGVANLVFCIMGTMSANKGVPYRYPFAIRLIK